LCLYFLPPAVNRKVGSQADKSPFVFVRHLFAFIGCIPPVYFAILHATHRKTPVVYHLRNLAGSLCPASANIPR
jgi:hypothetical protein